MCAEHLRQYNEALHQSNTIRMSDAYRFLDKYYSEEGKKKYDPDEEETIAITDTERFLFTLFKGISIKLNNSVAFSFNEVSLCKISHALSWELLECFAKLC